MRHLSFKNLLALVILIALYFFLLQRESFILAFALIWLALPYFYFPIVIGIAYIYFAKKLKVEGVKQHLLGGGIAGISLPLFIFLFVVPLSNLVQTMTDRFSPFPPSPTSVYSTFPSFQENIQFILIFGFICTLIGAAAAAVCYELWPKVRHYFKLKLGLGVD